MTIKNLRESLLKVYVGPTLGDSINPFPCTREVLLFSVPGKKKELLNTELDHLIQLSL